MRGSSLTVQACFVRRLPLGAFLLRQSSRYALRNSQSAPNRQPPDGPSNSRRVVSDEPRSLPSQRQGSGPFRWAWIWSAWPSTFGSERARQPSAEPPLMSSTSLQGRIHGGSRQKGRRVSATRCRFSEKGSDPFLWLRVWSLELVLRILFEPGSQAVHSFECDRNEIERLLQTIVRFGA